MAREAVFVRGAGPASVLRDEDWMIVLDALLQDGGQSSQQLLKKLLSQTKYGRLARMLWQLRDEPVDVADLQKKVGISRRSVFRYLTALESLGVSLRLDESNRYHLDRVPKKLKRLVSQNGKSAGR